MPSKINPQFNAFNNLEEYFTHNNHKYQYIFKEDYYEYKTTYYK